MTGLKQPWRVARLVSEYSIRPEEAAAMDQYSPLTIEEQLVALRAADVPVHLLAHARRSVA